jgi:hypothetical protein
MPRRSVCRVNGECHKSVIYCNLSSKLITAKLSHTLHATEPFYSTHAQNGETYLSRRQPTVDYALIGDSKTP